MPYFRFAYFRIARQYIGRARSTVYDRSSTLYTVLYLYFTRRGGYSLCRLSCVHMCI